MGWRDYAGGISDEATIGLDNKIKDMDGALDELNIAQGNAKAAAQTLKSLAEFGLELVKVAGPIVESHLKKKVVEEVEGSPEPDTGTDPIGDIANMKLLDAVLSTILKIKI